MKLNLSNRWFRLSLTKIADAMIVVVLFKRRREPKAEAIEQVRIPATARIVR